MIIIQSALESFNLNRSKGVMGFLSFTMMSENFGSKLVNSAPFVMPMTTIFDVVVPNTEKRP